MHFSFVSHRLSLTITGILFSLFLPLSAHAATLYWVGNDGASTNTASNWKTTDPSSCGSGDAGAAPVAGDTVIFDRDCDNGASIDSTLTVTTFTMQNGYSGTVTQANGIVITINGNLTQSGGTFTGGNSKINIIDGNFTLRGGTFTNTSETSSGMTVERNFTVNGGTFSNTSKKVTLADSTSADDTTITCSETLGGTFIITKDNDGDFINRTGCTLSLGATPTTIIDHGAANPFTNSGTITITSGTWTVTGQTSVGLAIMTNRGTLTHSGDGWDMNDVSLINAAGAVVTYGGSTISIEGSLTQLGTFNLTGVTVTFDDTGSTDDSTVTCSGTLSGTIIITKDSDGDFKNSTGCSMSLGASPTTTIDNGAVNPFTNSGTISISSGTWTINSQFTNAHVTLSNRGTITHSGNGWDMNDTHFKNFTNATTTYAGTGITIEGSFTQSGSFVLTGKTITFDSNSSADASTITCAGTLGGTVVITKTTTAGFTNAAGCTINLGANPTSLISGGTNNGTILIPSGTWTLNLERATVSFTNNGTITHSGDGWDINMTNTTTSGNTSAFVNSSTGIVGYSGGTLSFETGFTQLGTFDLTGKTLTFDDDSVRDSGIIKCNGVLGGTVVISKDDSSSTTLAVTTGCTVNLGTNPTSTILNLFTNSGTMIIAGGRWYLPSTGTLTNRGTITHAGNGWSSSGQTINTVSGTMAYSGSTIQLERNFTQSGSFVLTGKAILFTDTDTGDDTTVTCNGTLGGTVAISKDSGGDFKNATNCTISLGASPTTTMNGSATSPFVNSGTIVIASGTWTLNGSGTLANRGTITHSGNGWDINNGVSLTNYPGKTITYAGSSITLDGNLTQSGTLNLSSTTLTFDGSSSSTLLCGGTIGTLIISKTSASTALASQCTVTNLSVTAGTFDLNGYNLTVSSTFSNEGTVSLLGSESVSWTMDIDSGTILYRGTGGILSLGNVYNNLVLQEGLVGYWKLDETAAGTSADRAGENLYGTGNGPNGTNNKPQPSTDVPATVFSNGRSLHFDGIDDYVDAGNNALVQVTGAMTLSAWFKGQSSGVNSNGIGKLGNAGTRGYALQVSNAGGVTAHIASDNTNLFSVSTTGHDPTVWVHYTMVFEPSVALRLYRNGIEIATNTASVPASQYAASNNFAIGRRWGVSDSAHFSGLLDDVRLYNRVLSSSEIAALASGSEHPLSSITYTLSAPLNVRGNLTVQGVTLDTSSNRYALDYGSLTNNGTINMHGSTTAQTQAGGGSGGGGGGGIGRRTPSSSSSSPSSSGSEEGSSGGGSPSLFKDVPSSSWFAPFIEILVKAKIITGYKDIHGNLTGFFGPSDPVTYAEVATIALRLRKETPPPASPFNPTAMNHWASSTIALAEKERWSPYTSLPTIDTPMPRGAVIQALLEALHIPLTEKKHAPFSDVRDNHPFKDAIVTAFSLGIISGDTNRDGTPTGTFRPNDPINRAEVSKIVALLLVEMEKKN